MYDVCKMVGILDPSPSHLYRQKSAEIVSFWLPPLPHPTWTSYKYGTVGDKRNFLGSKMVYECEEGHMPSGSLSRECLEGGRWSGSPPKCTYVDCGDPPELGRNLCHVFCECLST